MESVDFYCQEEKNIFLSFYSHKSFSILRDITVPETLQDFAYSNILSKAKALNALASSKIELEFKFQKLLEISRKIIAEFLNDLSKLSIFFFKFWTNFRKFTERLTCLPYSR